MLIETLHSRGLLHVPGWLPNSVHFLGYTGSVSYGVSGDTSDMDCAGFCVPPKAIVFPESHGGGIAGFDIPTERWRGWQQHHVSVPNERKTYDFAVHNVVDFFHLAMVNNPNVLDLLFLPRRCILHSTPLGEHVRQHRHLFLHKGAMQRLRGYMFSQMSKIKNRANSTNPKRTKLIEDHGYDTKFGMHVVRLALQAEQILLEHDLDLERNSEILKSVRRGEWSFERLDQWAAEKELTLEVVSASSTLRAVPDEAAIKALLIETLEMHYGRLDVRTRDTSVTQLLADMQTVIDRHST